MTSLSTTTTKLNKEGRAALVLFLLVGAVFAGGAFVLFFVVPLAYMFIESLSPPLMSGSTTGQLTLANYWILASDPFYREIMIRTFRVALFSSLLMLVCGYPVAYLLRIVSPQARARLLLLVISPLLVSVVVRTYGWVMLLGKEGLLNTILNSVGINGRFASITHLFNEVTVVIGVAHVFIPFMILAIYNSLQKLNLTLIKAAANLGAKPYRAFLEVTLPLSLPGVVAGLATVFPLAMGSFITVAVLGGPAVWVISMSAYQESMTLLNWQLAGAIGISLLVTMTLLVGVFMLLASRFEAEQVRR